MDQEDQTDPTILQRLNMSNSPLRVLVIILAISVITGVAAGYILASGKNNSASPISLTNTPPKTPQQDNRTFRDFAQGVIKKKPQPSGTQDYSDEGTHLLIRDNNPYPVALTSSVVDLSQYEGKKVKVYGETQKAVKEGWLMDVGKVEVVK